MDFQAMQKISYDAGLRRRVQIIGIRKDERTYIKYKCL